MSAGAVRTRPFQLLPVRDSEGNKRDGEYHCQSVLPRARRGWEQDGWREGYVFRVISATAGMTLVTRLGFTSSGGGRRRESVEEREVTVKLAAHRCRWGFGEREGEVGVARLQCIWYCNAVKSLRVHARRAVLRTL